MANITNTTIYLDNASKIKSFNSIDTILNYVQKNSSTFDPYTWVATANRIVLCTVKGTLPLTDKNKIFINNQFRALKLDSFDNAKLLQVISFYTCCMKGVPLLQIFMQKMMNRLNNPTDLTHFVENFGMHFDIARWQIAIQALNNGGATNIDKLVLSNLNPNLLKSGLEIVQSNLKNIGYKTQLSLDPKEITFQLSHWRMSKLPAFFLFSKNQAHHFNDINWAAFATKIHMIQSPIAPEDINPILDALITFSSPFGAKEIVQVIGGLLPFMEGRRDVADKLINYLKIHKIEPGNLILLLHAARSLPQNHYGADRITTSIAIELFMPFGMDLMKQRPDLFAVAVHSCGQRGLNIGLDETTQFIVDHASQFSSRIALELLEGLNYWGSSVDRLAVGKIVDVLLEKIPMITNIQSRFESMTIATTNLTTIQFVDPHWIAYVLKEAQNPDLFIWNKIQLIYSFVRMGLFEKEVPMEMKQFVEKTAQAYLQLSPNEAPSKYPADGVRLAYALAKISGKDQDLSHKVIKFASLQSANFNEIDKGMMRKAISMAGYNS